MSLSCLELGLNQSPRRFERSFLPQSRASRTLSSLSAMVFLEFGADIMAGTMDKKSLSERDICTKFITPALCQAGWDEMAQIREEVSFTKGRPLELRPRARRIRGGCAASRAPTRPPGAALQMQQRLWVRADRP